MMGLPDAPERSRFVLGLGMVKADSSPEPAPRPFGAPNPKKAAKKALKLQRDREFADALARQAPQDASQLQAAPSQPVETRTARAEVCDD